MTAALILNQSQAEAVYSAICALNNIGNVEGGVSIHGARAREDIWISWDSGVTVRCGALGGRTETYWHQGDFATAYGLNSDEPQSAVAAAAGGLTQTAIER